MYLLPAIRIEETEIRLPCPALHLLQLAGRICGPMADDHVGLSSFGRATARRSEVDYPLLFNSPALLLFAMAHCRDESDGPESWGELSHWVDQRLLPLLSHVAPLSETDDFLDWENQKHKIALQHRRFLYQPSCSRLMKFLREVSSGQGIHIGKRACKEWILNSRMGSQDLPELPETESERVIRTDDVIEASYYQVPSASGFATIWPMVHDYARLAVEFTDRLRLEKLKSLKQLAYGASHEVNNPLANIATRAETLIRKESNPEKRRLLSIVHAQSMRAHDMIADMMLFANPPRMTMETRDLAKLTGQLLGELQEELQESEIEVLIRSYPGVRMVPVDPTHFCVAMKALLRNSIEAIGSDGQIRVRFFRESSHWLGVSVVDTGPGVSPDQADHLFDPFYSGREAGRGLGFGLAKAWRIINEHGGDIFCDYSSQNGGKFEIRLPVSQKSASRIDIARAA